MNMAPRACRLAAIFTGVLLVPTVWGLQRDPNYYSQSGQTGQGTTVQLTASQAEKVVNCLEEKGYSLKEAIDEAAGECDGTPVAAESRLIRDAEYAQKFGAGHDDDNWNQRGYKKGEKVLFQVACGSADRAARPELVAVCPETEKAILLTGAGFERETRNVGFEEDRYYQDQSRRRDRGFDTDDDYGYMDRARDNRFGTDDDWFDGDDSRMRMDIRKGSELIGADVIGMDGDQLGDIEDLAIDPQTGRIQYAVLATGGFLGIGDSYFAVPWQALRQRDHDTFALNMDERTLENMSGFDKNHWPATANRQFLQRGRYGQGYASDDYRTRQRGFVSDRGSMVSTTIDLNPQRTRIFAKALEDNNFDLKEAIDQGEQHTGGKAVAAKCTFADAATRRQMTGRFNEADDFTDRNRQFDSDTDDFRGGNWNSPENIVVEVVCVKPGETNRATVVTLSPKTKEVITTRDRQLSQARHTSGTD